MYDILEWNILLQELFFVMEVGQWSVLNPHMLISLVNELICVQYANDFNAFQNLKNASKICHSPALDYWRSIAGSYTKPPTI